MNGNCLVGKRIVEEVPTCKIEVRDNKRPKLANDFSVKQEPDDEVIAVGSKLVSVAEIPLPSRPPRTFAPFVCKTPTREKSPDEKPQIMYGPPLPLSMLNSRPVEYGPQAPDIEHLPLPKTPTYSRGPGRPPGSTATPNRTLKSRYSRTPELSRTPTQASHQNADTLRTPLRSKKHEIPGGAIPMLRTPVKRYSNDEGTAGEESVYVQICKDIIDNIIEKGHHGDPQLHRKLCEKYGIIDAGARSRLSGIKGNLTQYLKAGRIPRWADEDPEFRAKMQQAVEIIKGVGKENSIVHNSNIQRIPASSNSLTELQQLVDRIHGEMREKEQDVAKAEKVVEEVRATMARKDSQLAKLTDENKRLTTELTTIRLLPREEDVKRRIVDLDRSLKSAHKTIDDLRLANIMHEGLDPASIASMTFEELRNAFNCINQQVEDLEGLLVKVKRMVREKQP